MKNAIWLKSKTVDVEIEDMDLCWHPVPNTCPPGEQYGRPAEQSNHALAYMNTQSNLCCIPTSTGSQKLVPLDVYGRPNIDRWTTAYHEAYNTYHDPRDGITFNWKTEEERLQEKAGCIGCQHGPTRRQTRTGGNELYQTTLNLCHTMEEGPAEVAAGTIRLQLCHRLGPWKFAKAELLAGIENNTSILQFTQQ
ncbi:uncharacterized protein LOC122553566 isoform X3 [Chiloscyllium plagiosum]|uniref:uncharacterized protein LOC122553566 isoform X3 n=1 Tax=Chiloscyllium plagiosum TaxID=36176 RepID=UPI001CB88945|nr:uncharacterized protein LOC122553566 isoform X3 [Chiloscyllium plagiosum]